MQTIVAPRESELSIEHSRCWVNKQNCIMQQQTKKIRIKTKRTPNRWKRQEKNNERERKRDRERKGKKRFSSMGLIFLRCVFVLLQPNRSHYMGITIVPGLLLLVLTKGPFIQNSAPFTYLQCDGCVRTDASVQCESSEQLC